MTGSPGVPSPSRSGALRRVRGGALTPAFALAGALVTAWAAGWFTAPVVVFTSPLPVEAGPGAHGFRARADLVVRDADWRPVTVSATIGPAPGPGTAAAAPRVTMTTAAGLMREAIVAGPTTVSVTLAPVRGAGPGEALTLAVAPEGEPVVVRDMRARYSWDWTAIVTVMYGALVGAWFWRAFVAGRTVNPAPATVPAFTGARGAAALSLVALSLIVLRKSDAVLVPQLWAEDGAIFFAGAWNDGFRAVLVPYAGYLHLFPRLVAEAAVHAAPAVVPVVFLAAAVLPVLAVGSLLGSRRLPLTGWERVGCMVLLAVPPMPGDVLLNATNAQWVLGFAPALLLIARPAAASAGVVADVGVLAWAGSTGPFALVFAPLFILRALWARGAATAVPAIAISGCAAVQGFLLVSSGRLERGQPVPFDLVVANLGRRSALLLRQPVSEDAGFLIGTVLAGAVILFLVALLLERARVAGLLVGAGFLAIGGIMLGTRAVDYGLAAGGERYFSLPVGLMLWGCLVGRRTCPRLGAALIATVLVLTAPSLLVAPLRDLHWAEASACLSRPEPCSIPINPLGWSLHVRGRQDH